MKKLLAAVIVLLCASCVFAKEINRKYKTGDYIKYGFNSSVRESYQDISGKRISYEPRVIHSIIPYNDGYILKMNFIHIENAYPIIELFVKPGMVFETENSECSTIKIIDVKPNEIELCFNVAD